jgi:hypothetical protein
MHVFAVLIGTSNIFVTSGACGNVSYCVENATLASHSQPCVTTYESRLPLSLVVAIKRGRKWRCAQLASCWHALGQQCRRCYFLQQLLLLYFGTYVGVQAATRCVVHCTKPYRIGGDGSGCSTRLGHAVCWQLFWLLQMAAVDIVRRGVGKIDASE